MERKLFGGVCGKKASLKIAWDAFRAVGATFRLFLGVCVATETSEDRLGSARARDVVQVNSNRFAHPAEANRFAHPAEANRFADSAEAYRFAGSAEARKSTSTPFVRRAPSTMENQGSRCKIAIPGVHLLIL